MKIYILAAIVSPFLTAFLVLVIYFFGQGSETVRYIVLFTSFLSAVPLMLNHLLNVILCRNIKIFSFFIVMLISLLVYSFIFWISIFIMASADSHVDFATLAVFGFSIIPFGINMFLFWKIGIQGNELFRNIKLQRWSAG